jgi:hypothetical protein
MTRKETCIRGHTRTAVKWAGRDPKSPVGHSHEGKITLVPVILAEVAEGLQVIDGIEMNAGLYHPVLQTLSKICQSIIGLPTNENTAGIPESNHQVFAFTNRHSFLSRNFRKVNFDVGLQVLFQGSRLSMDDHEWAIL